MPSRPHVDVKVTSDRFSIEIFPCSLIFFFFLRKAFFRIVGHEQILNLGSFSSSSSSSSSHIIFSNNDDEIDGGRPLISQFFCTPRLEMIRDEEERRKKNHPSLFFPPFLHPLSSKVSISNLYVGKRQSRSTTTTTTTTSSSSSSSSSFSSFRKSTPRLEKREEMWKSVSARGRKCQRGSWKRGEVSIISPDKVVFSSPRLFWHIVYVVQYLHCKKKIMGV